MAHMNSRRTGRPFAVLCLVLACAVACNKAADVAPDWFGGFKKPANFPEPVYDLNANPINQAGFELGRKLFHDPLLSRNNTISCASCHIQSSAFTHHGHDVSHGIDDKLGTRNAPPIMNLAWSKNFFWDGGVFHLDMLAIAPIENPVEMDESLMNVLAKLRQHTQYPRLFEKAFGSPEISTANFLKALSQFMLMAVSSNAKYDKVMRGEGHTAFTADEQAGYAVYQQHCAGCHAEPLFTDQSFRDNGLGPNPINDQGRYMITLNDTDSYKFKVPSLRNLKYTAPYMHDGRLLTLAAVIAHYRREVRDTPNLDPLLRNPDGSRGIVLSETEKTDLLAFLQTLNDEKFVTDPFLGVGN